ncbi:KdsC family phosphatase [Spirosoma fluviale]|uniref:3-deoxy-D-manno-octulosonate 8-phosphate phosphatase (KDO 8-P phosphatase) n=1 Tax=Spirosoma fluviale TaxID=1597977 RepID=A0A286GMT0_9BACT|nr:3-deoxy-D-manno-octulosonate 8-phosphate phosphatase [Spirosoma fluviale]SOD96486.1 3-deoxy-D-manno-octulosonate 8-phosphate phosphatase (KDO 8-P phosphatase) [Spirosoma fluviale]
MTAVEEQFRQIKTFIFDIDGVLTDGGVSLLASGERYRTVFIRDTYAIEQALKADFRVAIISAANADGLRSWLTSMNVKDIFMGGPSDQKVNAFLGYIARDGLNESEILYMGDDLPDLPILNRSAVLSTCPADAVDEVQAVSQYISPKVGGRGAVRDVIEQVMKTQGKWGL